jgi:hypothetical protein
MATIRHQGPSNGRMPRGPANSRSTRACVAFGAIAGGMLGSADGFLLHYALSLPARASDGLVWGAALGAGGGAAYALLQRALRGAGAEQWIGTTLGFLYGLIPGVVLFFRLFIVERVVIVGWPVSLWFIAGAVLGLLPGAALDRGFDAVLPPGDSGSEVHADPRAPADRSR